MTSGVEREGVQSFPGPPNMNAACRPTSATVQPRSPKCCLKFAGSPGAGRGTPDRSAADTSQGPAPMTTLKSTLFAAVAGVLALQPLTTSIASADGWRRQHGGYGGYGRSYGHPRPAYGYGYGYAAPQQHHRRDRTGRAVGAAVLGIGALIVGAAIADAARRDRQRSYEQHYTPRYDPRYED